MSMQRRDLRLCAALLMLLLGAAASADRIELTDGTVLEGTVVEMADSYWIKTADGNSRMLPKSQVKSVSSAGGTAQRPADNPSASASVRATRRQAEAVETPLAAVAIWQKFLDTAPDPADRASAQAELARWNKLAADDAEKINGQWIGGAQRRELIARANALTDQAADLIQKDQTLAAIPKLEQAVRLYPNSYQALFTLGYLELVSRDETSAIRHFEAAMRLRPNSAEALNNLGVALLSRKEFTRAVDLICRSAEARDNQAVAQNLINVTAVTPERLRNTPRFKAAMEASRLLAGKYRLTGPSGKYVLMAPRPGGATQDAEELPGVRSSGSGFIIRADGLILTNRHVVEGGSALLVLMPDNQRKSAEVVSIDEQQDLALIRIKAEPNLPIATFSAADLPPEGAVCFAMGYPLIDRMGATVKITQGIVAGRGRVNLGTDIVVDAKVNPGNSGGPLLDARGQVIGIVTMKSRSTATEDSYGLAISAGRVREFLGRNNIKLQPADAPGIPMTAEQVAARLKPSTVCILNVR